MVLRRSHIHHIVGAGHLPATRVGPVILVENHRPLALLQVGTVTREQLSILSQPASRAFAALVVETEEWLRQRRESLSALLFDLIRATRDERDRSDLVQLRRDLYNLRPPRTHRVPWDEHLGEEEALF